MRDLIFKHLTSESKKRKIIATSETTDKQGVRSIIRRHFVCLAREIKDNRAERPLPYLYVLRKHNPREQKEKFFCRIKGSICIVDKGRLFLVLFMHSLKITLGVLPQDCLKQS